MAESRKTDNIPAKWQQLVYNAITLSYERQGKDQKDWLAMLREVYEQLQAQFKASGADPEEVPAWLTTYCAKAIYRMMAYTADYSIKNPASHRKGYGIESYTEIHPDDLLFKFDGSADDDWTPGPGDDFPDPEPAPDEDPDGPWWEPMAPNRIDVVRRVKDEHPDDWQAGTRGSEAFIRRLAWELHLVDPKFGLNGKRQTTTLSKDVVAYLNPTVDNNGLPGCEIIDVIVNSDSPSASVTWNNITVPYSWNGVGARWIEPEPVD